MTGRVICIICHNYNIFIYIVETVAIVEPLRQDDTADTFLPDTSLNNTNNGEEQSVPLIPKDNSPEICPNSSVSQQNSPTSARALLLRRHNQAAADAARPKSQPPDSHLWNITTLPQVNILFLSYLSYSFCLSNIQFIFYFK